MRNFMCSSEISLFPVWVSEAEFLAEWADSFSSLSFSDWLEVQLADNLIRVEEF